MYSILDSFRKRSLYSKNDSMKDSKTTKRIIRTKILCFLSHSNRTKSKNVQGSDKPRTLHHHCNSRSHFQRATAKFTRNFYFRINKVQILWLLISLLILIWFWSRVLNQVFSRLSRERFSKWILLLRGGVLVLVLFGYERLLPLLGLDHSLLFLRENITLWSTANFLVYSLLIVIGITFIFKQIKNKKIWIQILVAVLTLIILAFIGTTLNSSTLILYTLLAASVEEFFKFTVGNNQSESTNKTSPSTLLLFSLLIGFSFGIAENVLAFVLQLIQWSTITTGMLVWRGLLTALIHIVATGSIAFVMMNYRNIGLFWRYILALLLGFTIHSIYNLSLQGGLSFVSILLAVAGGIALSYLIFHLDELYE